MNQFVNNFLKGIGIGSANVIPGVSGGTIALLTGIFERLINCLKSFNITALQLLFKGKFKELAKHVDLWFLLSVGAGVIVSILTIAKLFEIWLAGYYSRIYLMCFFLGLVIASIYYVGKTVKNWDWKSILAFIIGAGIAFAIFVLNYIKETGVESAEMQSAEMNRNFIYVMICGAIGICSMILPGLSGSYVLLMMGVYDNIIVAISNLDLGVLIPFAIGAIAGLLAFSHVLSWIFKRFPDITIALLTGFILGSLPVIYPWRDAITNELAFPEANIKLAIAIVIALIGAAVIVLTEKMAAKKQ
ncbi:MAG: DUF368 domain-containing protein [Bacteroidales bacterium]|nr:DUF368 domain-containing protein [Bacteroidales bacterium]